jgi:hypothetical protein
VYHRTPLLSPWIRELGYGMTAECDTIDLGQGEKTPDDASGEGHRVPRRHRGHESRQAANVRLDVHDQKLTRGGSVVAR